MAPTGPCLEAGTALQAPVMAHGQRTPQCGLVGAAAPVQPATAAQLHHFLVPNGSQAAVHEHPLEVAEGKLKVKGEIGRPGHRKPCNATTVGVRLNTVALPSCLLADRRAAVVTPWAAAPRRIRLPAILRPSPLGEVAAAHMAVRGMPERRVRGRGQPAATALRLHLSELREIRQTPRRKEDMQTRIRI